MANDVTSVQVQYSTAISKLAEQYDTSVEKILAANPGIKQTDTVYAGEVINVPVSVFDDPDVIQEVNVDSLNLSTSALPAKPDEETSTATSETESKSDGFNWGKALAIGATVLGVVGAGYYLFKKGKLDGIINFFKKKPAAPQVMKPNAQAREALARVEGQLSRPTDYRAASEALIPKAAPDHAARQADLEAAFASVKTRKTRKPKRRGHFYRKTTAAPQASTTHKHKPTTTAPIQRRGKYRKPKAAQPQATHTTHVTKQRRSQRRRKVQPKSQLSAVKAKIEERMRFLEQQKSVEINPTNTSYWTTTSTVPGVTFRYVMG